MSDSERSTIQKFTRREVVEKLLAGMAATAAWPLMAASHPIHQHVKNGAAMDRAEAAQKAAQWKPVFLNPQQNETLVALSERMVPGSTKARVNRFIDLLLSVDAAKNQEQFAAALSVIDTESQKRFTRAFHQSPLEQQDALLTTFSEEEKHKETFEYLKQWITVAYYSSEEGMRELGWNENRAFAHFPDC